MITHDYSLIFIHIPKCAGRSICDAFNQRFDHFTAQYYTTEYPTHWKHYTKFTIVRNPYARLLSVYNYVKEHRRHQHEPIGKLANRVSFSEWLKQNIDCFEGEYKFDSPEAMRGTDGMIGSPFWFSSQSRRLEHEVGPFQIISGAIKIFKLEEGMAQIERFILHETGKLVSIPHANKSENKGKLSIFSAYSEPLLDIVNQFAPIVKDCNYLNYNILETSTVIL